MTDEFSEPPTGANFLERYRVARAGSQPNSPKIESSKPPQSPPSPRTPHSPQTPRSPQSPRIAGRNRAEAVWHSVFHPLGKSPKTADRYDLGRGVASGLGESVSEIHDLGRMGNNLDEKKED